MSSEGPDKPSPPPEARNITWHRGAMERPAREAVLGQRGCLVWMTGLSGSGKSTVAHALEAALAAEGHAAYVLDGDNVRHGLNADLGFSEADRVENIRRLGHVAALFVDAGLITISAFISPFRADRASARALVPEGRFLEVFCDASLTTCEARDPKGLYKKARAGQLREFTGIDSPYEAPEEPEVHLRTDGHSVEESVESLLGALRERGLLSSR